MKTKSIISKKTFRSLGLLLSVVMLFSFAGLSAQTKDNNREKIVFNVYMDCNNCKAKIEKNIAFEKGVKDLDADLEKQTVAVTYDKRRTDVKTLQTAFKKLGFEAKLPESNCCSSEKKQDSCCSKEKAENCSLSIKKK